MSFQRTCFPASTAAVATLEGEELAELASQARGIKGELAGGERGAPMRGSFGVGKAILILVVTLAVIALLVAL